MNQSGRSRNARLNKALQHGKDVIENITRLAGHTMHEYVDEKDAWQDARNALEQLTQCFHEANAYNNAMKVLK